MAIHAWPAHSDGQWKIGLRLDNDGSLADVRKTRTETVESELRQVRDGFFAVGNGRKLVEMRKRIQDAESEADAAAKERDTLRTELVAAVTANDLAGAEKIETRIAAAQATAERLAARVAIVRDAAAGLPQALAVELDGLLRARAREISERGAEAARESGVVLGQLIESEFLEWFGHQAESAYARGLAGGTAPERENRLIRAIAAIEPV